MIRVTMARTTASRELWAQDDLQLAVPYSIYKKRLSITRCLALPIGFVICFTRDMFHKDTARKSVTNLVTTSISMLYMLLKTQNVLVDSTIRPSNSTTKARTEGPVFHSQAEGFASQLYQNAIHQLLAPDHYHECIFIIRSSLHCIVEFIIVEFMSSASLLRCEPTPLRFSTTNDRACEARLDVANLLISHLRSALDIRTVMILDDSYVRRLLVASEDQALEMLRDEAKWFVRSLVSTEYQSFEMLWDVASRFVRSLVPAEDQPFEMLRDEQS